MPSVTVHYGRLLQVLGKPVRHAGVVFMGCLTELQNEPVVDRSEGCQPALDYPLTTYTSSALPPSLAVNPNQDPDKCIDALWVRARIPAVFGFAPISMLHEELKYSLLEQAFVACIETGDKDCWSAYPFVCRDSHLSTGLQFSPDGPAAKIRARIAQAFWNLLQWKLDDVHPYRDGYFWQDGYGGSGWVVAEFGHRGYETWNYDPAHFADESFHDVPYETSVIRQGGTLFGRRRWPPSKKKRERVYVPPPDN